MLIYDDVRQEDLANLHHLQMPCATIITTRISDLSIVPPQAMLSLEILSEDEALALCREVLGEERVNKERDSPGELFDAAGYLPLALNILLRRLYNEATLTAHALAGRMADRKRAIKETSNFDDPNLNVRASFDLSYNALKPEQQRLFRTLGVFDSGTFRADIVAAILQISEDDARNALDKMVEFSLAERGGESERYRLHPLLHSYAQGLLSENKEGENPREQSARAYLRFARTHTEPARWKDLELEINNIFGLR